MNGAKEVDGVMTVAATNKYYYSQDGVNWLDLEKPSAEQMQKAVKLEGERNRKAKSESKCKSESESKAAGSHGHGRWAGPRGYAVRFISKARVIALARASAPFREKGALKL